ncbi:hypothetical protein PILCRDRAFT_579958 [Piloderma croceum F 1598]|uniref:Uncharacterized protein n=1 Tax=Piloderma croceum (strain F 1598) TaxID=765440 RepID=A0A0C3FGG0_PILCF|nr:hypothetical protein PILCRDRAFT_579958 [Piloderma croceum F 1598]
MLELSYICCAPSHLPIVPSAFPYVRRRTHLRNLILQGGSAFISHHPTSPRYRDLSECRHGPFQEYRLSRPSQVCKFPEGIVLAVRAMPCRRIDARKTGSSLGDCEATFWSGSIQKYLTRRRPGQKKVRLVCNPTRCSNYIYPAYVVFLKKYLSNNYRRRAWNLAVQLLSSLYVVESLRFLLHYMRMFCSSSVSAGIYIEKSSSPIGCSTHKFQIYIDC